MRHAAAPRLLLRLRDLIGRQSCQYIDVERIATTPERFLLGHPRLLAVSSRASSGAPRAGRARGVRRHAGVSRHLAAARGAPATFLLDEFLELRTFESFPGLRTVLHDLIEALSASGNRFVLTSRYPARAMRLLREAPGVFEVIHVTPLTHRRDPRDPAAPEDGPGARTGMRGRGPRARRARTVWCRRSPTAGLRTPG